MLVERRGKLLSRPCQLLAQIVCFQCEIIPFVLERSEERGDRGQGRGTRSRDARRLDGQQIIGRDSFAVGFCAVLVDVLFYQPLLIDDPLKEPVSQLVRKRANFASAYPTSWTRPALEELLRRLHLG